MQQILKPTLKIRKTDDHPPKAKKVEAEVKEETEEVKEELVTKTDKSEEPVEEVSQTSKLTSKSGKPHFTPDLHLQSCEIFKKIG